MSTETPRETITDGSAPAARRDELAVAAVRGGDAERYRELVERYERLVYAVAWSRLGDAGLAEEAAQETFVRAYQRLALLGEGGKFGAWVAAIARHMAVSLGLRHRRELNRRERWQLEQPQVQEAAGGKETEKGKILREALAGMPENQRECLVLFYLEEKSAAEAAEALGISEAALRVRLHRARAALREKLEENLGESLRQLRPGKSVVPGVMAVVLSSSAAKTAGGAGIGAAVLAWLGKVLPVKVAAMAWAAPYVIFLWFLNFLERRKMWDPSGFRVRLHREYSVREIIKLAIPFLVIGWIFPWSINSRQLSFDVPFRSNLLVIIGLCGWPWVACVVRYQAVLDGKWRIQYFFPGAALMAIGMGFISTALIKSCGLLVIYGISFAIDGDFAKYLKLFDKNLFLRALERLLKVASVNLKSPIPAAHLNNGQIQKFGEFLWRKGLIADARWENGNLRLALPTVGPCLKFSYYLLGRSKRSELVLGTDGTVQARAGDWDKRKLSALAVEPFTVWAEVEGQVGWVVEEAWRSFRDGKFDAAFAVLGGDAGKPKPPVPSQAEAEAERIRLLKKRRIIAISILGAFLTVTLILIYL